MNTVFLDTGYLLALELSKDSNHAAAQEHWNSIRGTLPRLVTTTFVIDEVVTYFNNRGRHDKAAEIGGMLLGSPTVDLVFVDEQLFRDGWNLFLQHDDKQWSLTDCISFIVMRQRGISIAFAFDHHFEQAGFRKLP